MTDQPQLPPLNVQPVNAELVRTLRNLLTLAERGQLTGGVFIACDAQGGTFQMMHFADQQIAVTNVALDSAKAKLVSRMLVLEKQGQVSPILRAPGMPS